MTKKRVRLENELMTVPNTQRKIDLLNDLAQEMRYVDESKAFELSEQAHKLSSAGEFSDQPYQHGLARSLRVFEKLEDFNGQASALAVIGFLHFAIGDFAEALNCELKSLQYAKRADNQLQEDHAHGILAIVYHHSQMRFLQNESTENVSYAQITQNISDLEAEEAKIKAELSELEASEE